MSSSNHSGNTSASSRITAHTKVSAFQSCQTSARFNRVFCLLAPDSLFKWNNISLTLNKYHVIAVILSSKFSICKMNPTLSELDVRALTWVINKESIIHVPLNRLDLLFCVWDRPFGDVTLKCVHFCSRMGSPVKAVVKPAEVHSGGLSPLEPATGLMTSPFYGRTGAWR